MNRVFDHEKLEVYQESLAGLPAARRRLRLGLGLGLGEEAAQKVKCVGD
jgi:hypothetical protein